MGTSTHLGPMRTGSVKEGPTADLGYCLLAQSGTINANSTNAVSLTFYVPQYSRLVDFVIDTVVAFDSGTSAVLTCGTAAGLPTYITTADVATVGREAPTLSAGQLELMWNVGLNTAVVFTVTPTGATTVGTVRITMLYVQTV